jgi:hypothetical protein
MSTPEHPLNITNILSDVFERIAGKLSIFDVAMLASTCRSMRGHSLLQLKVQKTSQGIIVQRKHPLICEAEELSIINRGNITTSNSINVVNPYVIERLSEMTNSQDIEYVINDISVNYEKPLTDICTVPNLKNLTINFARICLEDEGEIDIDCIKEVVNAKNIHMIIKLPFPTIAFSHITDNIDHVTIVMSEFDRRCYSSDQEILFYNNKVLTIENIVIFGFCEMYFENVGQVKFINFHAVMMPDSVKPFVKFNNPSFLIYDDCDGLFDPNFNPLTGPYDDDDNVSVDLHDSDTCDTFARLFDDDFNPLAGTHDTDIDGI